MSTFRIDQQGGGDFSTIAQALRHCLLAQEKAPVLRLGPGVWREKLILRIPGLTLEGAGAEKTIIVWGDSALMPDDAGVPLGTFRTATVRVHAPGVTLRNLTVRNDAGPGDRVAQAVALYQARIPTTPGRWCPADSAAPCGTAASPGISTSSSAAPPPG